MPGQKLDQHWRGMQPENLPEPDLVGRYCDEDDVVESPTPTTVFPRGGSVQLDAECWGCSLYV